MGARTPHPLPSPIGMRGRYPAGSQSVTVTSSSSHMRLAGLEAGGGERRLRLAAMRLANEDRQAVGNAHLHRPAQSGSSRTPA